MTKIKFNSLYLQIISSFFFAVLGLQIKLLSFSMDIEGIVFYRCLLGTIIVLIIITFRKESTKLFYTKNMVVQFLRASFGTLAMFFGYSALKFIPIAQASSLSFTKIFFVSLLATFFLKEKISKTIFLAAISGFAGILIIVKPEGFNDFHGSSLSIISAFFVACGIICSSFLSKTNRTITIILYHSLYSSIICMLFFYSEIPLLKINEIISILLITITALIGQFFNTESYKSGEVNIIVLLGYSRIIFSFSLGFLFLNEDLNIEFVFGVLFVLFSSFLSSRQYKK